MDTSISDFDDLTHGSSGMDLVLDFIKSHGRFTSSCGRVLSRVRDKLILRCESCYQKPRGDRPRRKIHDV